MQNHYLIQFFDKLGNQIVPFGQINYLILPRIEQQTQTLHTLGSKATYEIAGRTEMTEFAATYENLEFNEGGKRFLEYFSKDESSMTRFCGSVFSSNPLQMLAYFDDAFLQSFSFNEGNVEFSLRVNDFEFCEAFKR